MKGNYTRLKLKLLLWVVLGTLAALLAGVFLVDVVLDGFFQDPIYRLFVWAAGALFGQSPESADLLYQEYVRANKPIVVAGVVCCLLYTSPSPRD